MTSQSRILLELSASWAASPPTAMVVEAQARCVGQLDANHRQKPGKGQVPLATRSYQLARMTLGSCPHFQCLDGPPASWNRPLASNWRRGTRRSPVIHM